MQARTLSVVVIANEIICALDVRRTLGIYMQLDCWNTYVRRCVTQAVALILPEDVRTNLRVHMPIPIDGSQHVHNKQHNSLIEVNSN